MGVIFKLNREIFPFLYQEIKDAKVSINAAIAWFTDPALLKLLINKKNIENVEVKIILFNDDINLMLGQLKKLGDSVMFSNDLKFNYIMHHKFCIIDDKRVITGSYNWTVKARRYNKENIVCIDDEEIISEFSKEFSSLLKNSKAQSIVKPIQNFDSNNSIEDIEIFNIEQRYNKLIDDRIKMIDKLNVGVDIALVHKLIDNRTPAIVASVFANAEGGNYIQSALLKLEAAGRLDLCFEESIIRTEYSKLFNKVTVELARQKLDRLDYFKNEKYSRFWGDYI
ncbi:phospholipase D-like domain-containing protein [Hymenobacter norwichensis]|uniref:phospholipase D-like domain-containing protein n=1 Tax=Hymenobacter norwichensis TaxID=223903 RepID=UPI0003B6ACB4|nr:phospholipase D-like domain-containing protein [Hymenobacter norwichensis]